MTTPSFRLSLSAAPVMLVALLLCSTVTGIRLLAANPAITSVLTADPAAMVHDGKVYLYTGHDEAPEGKSGYEMTHWLCFSSTDMVNCNTNHRAIIDYKGRSYFIYHNGGTPQGGSFRRSVCIDYLDYNADGTIKRIVQTSEGVSPATSR